MARQVLRITSRRDGFRRAGIRHPAGAIDHPVDRFSAKQIAALEAEPMLSVRYVDLPDETAAPKARRKGGTGKGDGKPA